MQVQETTAAYSIEDECHWSGDAHYIREQIW
jgi:hypothetical protein